MWIWGLLNVTIPIINSSKLTAAEKILWRNGILVPSDIDLEAIAYGLGASIRYRALDGCEARLVADHDKAIITVNSKNIATRQRFSIAHELGHMELDRGRGGFLCSKDDISPQNDAGRSAESAANDFASQLILPDYIFLPYSQGKQISIDSAEKIGAEFKASITATLIKLVRRAMIPAWVVCHKQRGIGWFFKSKFAPDDLYLHKNLHQDTDAFELLYGQEGTRTRYKTETGSRWFSSRDASRYQVRSQSMKAPDESVVSVISLT